MLKKLLTASAVSALMVSGALAQSTTTPPGSTTTPGATAAPGASGTTSGATTMSPSTSGAASSASSSGANSGQFVQTQRSDQFLATRFRGTDVIGPNDEKIGDVNDLVFDHQGKIEAVVIGVGGFLGIGEKDVALPMTAFQIVPADTGAGANTAANRGGAAGSNTGSTATTGTGASTGATAASNDSTNVRLKLSMTKDQLKGAPNFQPLRQRGAAGGGTGADTGSGAATSGRAGSGAATGATPRP